jgi:hypothetical protein
MLVGLSIDWGDAFVKQVIIPFEAEIYSTGIDTCWLVGENSDAKTWL